MQYSHCCTGRGIESWMLAYDADTDKHGVVRPTMSIYNRYNRHFFNIKRDERLANYVKLSRTRISIPKSVIQTLSHEFSQFPPSLPSHLPLDIAVAVV